ncbi:MAG: hypothetical protein Rubg2KO_21600 [Rubricoccaceae bacterium]
MSAPTQAVFLALVAFVCLALLVGVGRVSRDLSPTRRLRWRLGTALGLVAWLGVTAGLARAGFLSNFDVLPPRAPILLGALTTGTVAFAFSPIGARLAKILPLAALVGVQVFRVPLELVLHRLYVEGVLPVQITYTGWNFDIVTGLLAAVLAVALWRGVGGPRWVAAWNALGLVLLAIVVGTGLLSLPTPIQQFEPSTVAITTFPMIWLPTVLVMAALLGHLLVIRHLRLMSGGAGAKK